MHSSRNFLGARNKRHFLSLFLSRAYLTYASFSRRVGYISRSYYCLARRAEFLYAGGGVVSCKL